jgi:hypothetical protein
VDPAFVAVAVEAHSAPLRLAVEYLAGVAHDQLRNLLGSKARLAE